MAFHNDGKLLAADGYQAACERNEALVQQFKTRGDNMSNPIIVDCGGSTRIKRQEDAGGGVGAMNGLLDVDLTLNPPSSSHVVNRPFARVAVACVDTVGTPTQPLNRAVAANDKFTIVSQNGQTVVLQMNGNLTSLTITIQGQPGNPPLVEAKHFNKRRRYVAINAGAIQSITARSNNVDTRVNLPANPIYVTLVLNEP
jgi:hypothetical protein